MDDTPSRMHAKVTLDDGEVHEVDIDERDMRRFDLTFKSKGWPGAQEAPMLYQGFIAAAALIRTGSVPGTNPAELMEHILITDVEASEGTGARPTQPSPGNG